MQRTRTRWACSRSKWARGGASHAGKWWHTNGVRVSTKASTGRHEQGCAGVAQYSRRKKAACPGGSAAGLNAKETTGWRLAASKGGGRGLCAGNGDNGGAMRDGRRGRLAHATAKAQCEAAGGTACECNDGRVERVGAEALATWGSHTAGARTTICASLAVGSVQKPGAHRARSPYCKQTKSGSSGNEDPGATNHVEQCGSGIVSEANEAWCPREARTRAGNGMANCEPCSIFEEILCQDGLEDI
ncbi:hypothetical protein C8R45DRAFT_1177833 [Mycena sanguinolenta]|nr:hypothetical protein C8R45DRAFT_1177833 [Mycena sanguinolenta]